jgi:hypothetical protein
VKIPPQSIIISQIAVLSKIKRFFWYFGGSAKIAGITAVSQAG